MAYSDAKKLIDRTRAAAGSLGIAATWVNSRQPINMSTDFVYELYILFNLILDLSKSYNIKYIPGNGNKRHMFPKKPANKSGRPKFEVYSKTTPPTLMWQICSGTKVGDIVGMERAPDISFQKNNASDLPTADDVELIWDGKFRTDNDDRITHQELAEFARWLALLEIYKKLKPNIIMVKYFKMVANCLITNGNESTEPNAERDRLDLKEVANYYPGEAFRVIP